MDKSVEANENLDWQVIHNVSGQKLSQLVFFSFLLAQFRIIIAVGISAGMAALNKRVPPIQHRDLKSMNILLAEVYSFLRREQIRAESSVIRILRQR